MWTHYDQNKVNISVMRPLGYFPQKNTLTILRNSVKMFVFKESNINRNQQLVDRQLSSQIHHGGATRCPSSWQLLHFKSWFMSHLQRHNLPTYTTENVNLPDKYASDTVGSSCRTTNPDVVCRLWYISYCSVFDETLRYVNYVTGSTLPRDFVLLFVMLKK